MKKTLLLCGLALLSLSAWAQKATRQKKFQAQGYSLTQLGYPCQIVPTDKGSFSLVEYWVPGEGRQTPNYYLEEYDTQFEEEWFRPVTKAGTPTFKVQDLIRTQTSLAVVGKQYSATAKMEVMMAQFFDLTGKEQGGLIKLSNYPKKVKGYEDYFSLSPDSSKLLWMGHNPTATGKKRQYFFTVVDGKGAAVWSKPLVVPYVDKKYKVHQAEVDKRGNLYLLMKYETATNTAKDTANLPVLLRYDHKENKFTEYQVDIPAASVPECRIRITDRGELAFMGVLSDNSEKGFVNGAKRYGIGLKWNKLFYKQFNIERELKLAHEYLMDLPESWLTKYGTNGANFSLSEIREHDGRLYWIMEEFYTQIHNKQNQFLYYDIGVVAIDLESGAIRWASTFEKRQRDYNNGFLLSYTAGFANGGLQFVYLTERGAGGKIACSTLNLETGAHSFKPLVSNENSDNLFFPQRSAMIGGNRMILLGVGTPNMNEFKLIEITF